ncbi:putative entry exclusion protein TrbK-alt [Sphingomonas sp.]|uniref:putative entry exclusion protein TrbK-alt n=1 Tax=Sphingomonas sp. TaxID=28214 RepID=UPI00257D18D7|nr:putative entry exclusion protein TrbK-alt [Sphingomonas sp.]
MTEDQAKPVRRPRAGIGWRSAAVASGVGALGVIALVALADPAPQPPRFTVEDIRKVAEAVAVDPLRAELSRCRALPANSNDARCAAAWEVNRRRFMGESRSYVRPVEPPPIEPAPSVSSEAASAAPTDIPTPER